MSSKTTKKTENQKLRAFLKKRGLLKSFEKSKTIKKSRTVRISVDGFSRDLTAYKKNDRLVIADAFSLRRLTSTKRYTLNNFEKGFQKQLIKTSKKGAQKETYKKDSPLKLSVVKQTTLTNVIETRYIKARPKKQKANGKIFISITFKKGNMRRTVEGGSRRLRRLHVPSEFKNAFDEAFQGALSLIAFSYETFIINWVHYAYYSPRGD